MSKCEYYFCMMTASYAKVKVYPVFKPNQYFIDNFCKKETQEPKDYWKTYAKVIREEVIAKSFNFPLSDVTMEDKFKYKAILKGKKEDQKDD